jgi:hypothetical protein
MGTVLAAVATEIATTLPMVAYSSATALGGAGATAAYRAVGRTIATGNATVADVQLFNPNQL